MHITIHTHTHALPEGEIVRLAVTSSNWRMMTDLRTKTTTKHHMHTERAVLHRQTHSENSTIVQWIATHTEISIFAPQIDRLTHIILLYKHFCYTDLPKCCYVSSYTFSHLLSNEPKPLVLSHTLVRLPQDGVEGFTPSTIVGESIC